MADASSASPRTGASIPYQKSDEYIDGETRFHIVHLKNEKGHEHILQIALGHDSCPMCGHATLKNTEGVDVKNITADVISTLGESEEAVKAHSAKHGVRIR